jgi:DNA-binding IclR family transcriptional regulator
MAIFVLLGRDANKAGLPFETLVDAAEVSPNVTRRWLLVLIERGFVEELPGNRFKLSADGRARLKSVYS